MARAMNTYSSKHDGNKIEGEAKPERRAEQTEEETAKYW